MKASKIGARDRRHADRDEEGTEPLGTEPHGYTQTRNRM